jgi:RimJ/RimL family protein N-acetyltransferase
MILLRHTRPEDVDFVLDCERDPQVAPYITCWTHARHSEALDDPDCVHSIIAGTQPARPLGFALVFGASSPHHCVELRRLVIRHRGEGYGRAALRAVQAMAFGHLAAHRLWLDVQIRNPRARALYRSEGFVEEGVLRESVLVEGGYQSMALMAILRDEYKARAAPAQP